MIATSCETVTQHTCVTRRVLSSLTSYHQIRKLIQLTAQALVPTQVISDKNRLKEFFWFSYLWLKAFYIPELQSILFFYPTHLSKLSSDTLVSSAHERVHMFFQKKTEFQEKGFLLVLLF